MRGLAVVAVALFIAGCSRPASNSSPPSPQSSPPAETTTARDAVEEVCARFAVVALSSDTTIDRGPADARRRAADQFGTPRLAEQLAGEGRDHDWPLLAAHRARVQVDTEPIGDDPPPSTPQRASAGVIARRVAVGDAGWRQDLPSTATYCSLVRTGQGWRVDRVGFTDSTSSGAGR
jgi:hypothetical protein